MVGVVTNFCVSISWKRNEILVVLNIQFNTFFPYQHCLLALEIFRIAKEEENNDAMNDEELLKEQETGIMELGNK